MSRRPLNRYLSPVQSRIDSFKSFANGERWYPFFDEGILITADEGALFWPWIVTDPGNRRQNGVERAATRSLLFIDSRCGQPRQDGI
jgi:hypothetical protein